MSARASIRPDWAPDIQATAAIERPGIAAWFDRAAFVVPPALAGRFGYIRQTLLVGRNAGLLVS